MSLLRLILLTALALGGFAANSLLCRAALRGGAIDAGAFSSIRFAAGALMLVAIVGPRTAFTAGSWTSAAALAVYAIAFSYAYLALGAGIGAFVVFTALQATMIAGGLARGERPTARQWAGVVVAMIGLGVLTLPGGSVAASPPRATVAMAVAGIAFGIYSLRGRGAVSPLGATAGNFLRCLPLVALPAWFLHTTASISQPTAPGIGLAVVSGALSSALGYVCWYAALPHLTATTAGIIQVLVPVLTAAFAVAVLGETMTARLLMGGTVIVAGIGLTIARKRSDRRA